MSNGTLEVDGSTDTAHPNGTDTREVSMIVSGTWGGGTMTIYQNMGGTWTAVPDEAYTADFAKVFTPGKGVAIKGTLAGATSPDLDWSLT